MTKLYALTLLILVAGFLIPVHASDTGTLIVTVNQYCVSNGNELFAPLQAVKVTVIGQVISTAYSDQGGNVVFNLPVGSYTVIASRAGFMPNDNTQPFDVDVSSSFTSPVTLQLIGVQSSSNPCVTSIQPTPPPTSVSTIPNTGALLVNVRDYCTNDAGQIFMPLAGVEVSVPGLSTAITDEGGNAYFVNLNPNTYVVTASKVGFTNNDNLQPFSSDVWSNGTATVSLMLTPIGDPSCNIAGDPPPTTTTTLTSSASSTTVTATATTTVTTVTVTTTSVPEFPTSLFTALIVVLGVSLLVLRRKKQVSS